MLAAVALTVLALLGVLIGSFAGQSNSVSTHLAAAGGGVLSGICVFWLTPEIALTLGLTMTALLILAFALALVGFDRLLVHTGQSPRHGVVAPLMIATAVHSFLDGWSVSALAIRPLAGLAAPIGLGLHKLPEGLALGWINRKAMQSARNAILISASVELTTLLGAWIEPRVARSGEAAFGARWTAVVLTLVGGSFLFLGMHTVAEHRKRPGVLLVFFGGLLLTGIFAWAGLRG
jgi:hypothetical protein